MAKKNDPLLVNQFHEGKHYDRTEEAKYRSSVNVDANSKPVSVPKTESKPVPKPKTKPPVACIYCGNSFHYKGIYSHQARCKSNLEKYPPKGLQKEKNGPRKKPEWKDIKDLDFSILKELEKMHPDVISMIPAEQIKSKIINEIKKKRKEK